MKLGPVTKIEKRHTATSKNFDYEVILEKCDVIVIFLMYGQFGTIWKPDYGHVVSKIYTLIFH